MKTLLHCLWVWLFLFLSFASAGQDLAGSQVTLSGRAYQLQQLLGKGSFGEVYQAQSLSNPSHYYAIKVYADALAANNASFAFSALYDNSRASRAFLTMTPITSGILQSVDGGTYHFSGALAELARKETFSDLISMLQFDEKATNLSERIRAAHAVFRNIVMGLDHLASKRLVHGDIKPANLLILSDNNQPLSLAGIIAGEHRVIIGDMEGISSDPDEYTPVYQAPERRRGSAWLVSDHYSLGVVAIQILGADVLSSRVLQSLDRDTRARYRELQAYADAALERDPGIRYMNLVALANRNSLVNPNAKVLYEEPENGASLVVWLFLGGCAALSWLTMM